MGVDNEKLFFDLIDFSEKETVPTFKLILDLILFMSPATNSVLPPPISIINKDFPRWPNSFVMALNVSSASSSPDRILNETPHSLSICFTNFFPSLAFLKAAVPTARILLTPWALILLQQNFNASKQRALAWGWSNPPVFKPCPRRIILTHSLINRTSPLFSSNKVTVKELVPRSIEANFIGRVYSIQLIV